MIYIYIYIYLGKRTLMIFIFLKENFDDKQIHLLRYQTSGCSSIRGRTDSCQKKKDWMSFLKIQISK